jgi:NAD(P)H-nitrite reductase large subunit
MLKDGEKGVVLQRDKQTYAVAPHLVCGLADPQTLRKIADVAQRHNLTIKVTGEQRIALIGIPPEMVDTVWAELGMDIGHVVGNTVRGVKACPGTDFCKRGQQNSLAMGRILDERYHGKPLPGKMKFGVSGCPFQCAETSFKDIGLVGKPNGWTILVGGCGGGRPRIADKLVEDLPTEQAVQIVDRLVEYFKANAKPHDRMARLVERNGLDTLRQAIGIGSSVESAMPAGKAI